MLYRPGRALGLLLVALLAVPAAAVVIDSGDGSGNTTPPVDDFGFDHLGVADDNLSVIYLGWRWVLTANHVHEEPVTFFGNVYLPEPGPGIRLDGPDPSIQPDLLVYRLQQAPPLPVLPLSSTPVAVNDEVHCIGHGWNREADLTYWDVLWNETIAPGIYRGYKKATGRSVRWGRNEVTEADFDQELENGSGTVVSVTRSFATVFDETGGSVDESQAVSGDSGGGCFAKRGGEWELVGLTYARSLLVGQDQNWAVFGNESLAADVAYYRPQILSIISPAIPALPGAWGFVLAAGLVGSARAAGRRRPSDRERR